MKKIIKYIVLVIFFVLSFAVFSQDKKKEREIKRMQENRARQDFKAYKKAVKRQWKIQSPETRKRLRQDLRKTRKQLAHRKDFFLKRWFIDKRRKKKGHDDTTKDINL